MGLLEIYYKSESRLQKEGSADAPLNVLFVAALMLDLQTQLRLRIQILELKPFSEKKCLH